MERQDQVKWRLSPPMTNDILRKDLGGSYGITGIDVLNGGRSHHGQIVVFNGAELAEQIITEHNQHAALVEQRDRLVEALRQIAAYPSGYKFSGVISDEPSAGRDREEMIHLARSVLKELDTLATVEQEGES